MARYPLHRIVVWSFAALLVGCVERQAHNETENNPDQSNLIPNELEHANPSQLPWCVQGRITNGEAVPLSGVTVSAHCGMGTLMKTGEAVTDADGRYTLNFGPGLMLIDDGAQMQVATISASKSGMLGARFTEAPHVLHYDRKQSESKMASWPTTLGYVLLALKYGSWCGVCRRQWRESINANDQSRGRLPSTLQPVEPSVCAASRVA